MSQSLKLDVRGKCRFVVDNTKIGIISLVPVLISSFVITVLAVRRNVFDANVFVVRGVLLRITLDLVS